MKEIIKLIVKYHFTIIFVLLEILAFSLVVMHNNYQRTIFSGYTASFFGHLSSFAVETKNYWYLKETNQQLVAENTDLYNQIEKLKKQQNLVVDDSLVNYEDSIKVDYAYYNARIINSSTDKTKNYITINKGQKDGILPDMAVCCSEGIVGIIEKVSKNYARVLPLINTNLKISAKIKKNEYYGSLQWDGVDYRFSFLNDIPFHVEVNSGDSIVTSGFSSIFPEGKLIGVVESVSKETANFLSIKVKLATDFKKVNNVYVIAYQNKQEREKLEEDEL